MCEVSRVCLKMKAAGGDDDTPASILEEPALSLPFADHLAGILSVPMLAIVANIVRSSVTRLAAKLRTTIGTVEQSSTKVFSNLVAIGQNLPLLLSVLSCFEKFRMDNLRNPNWNPFLLW